MFLSWGIFESNLDGVRRRHLRTELQSDYHDSERWDDDSRVGFRHRSVASHLISQLLPSGNSLTDANDGHGTATVENNRLSDTPEDDLRSRRSLSSGHDDCIRLEFISQADDAIRWRAANLPVLDGKPVCLELTDGDSDGFRPLDWPVISRFVLVCVGDGDLSRITVGWKRFEIVEFHLRAVDVFVDRDKYVVHDRILAVQNINDLHYSRCVIKLSIGRGRLESIETDPLKPDTNRVR